MRLQELKNKFYHGSREKFPIGFMLTPQPTGYVHHPDEQLVEQLVENERPNHMLSRYNSVFLVDDPGSIDDVGGYIDYIYIVEPIGGVEKSDLGWYSEISIYAPFNPDMLDELKQYAQNYWAGLEKDGAWEYRTKSARIIGVLP